MNNFMNLYNIEYEIVLEFNYFKFLLEFSFIYIFHILQ